MITRKKLIRFWDENRMWVFDLMMISLFAYSLIQILPLFASMLQALTIIIEQAQTDNMSIEFRFMIVCVGIYLWLKVAKFFYYSWVSIMKKVRYS